MLPLDLTLLSFLMQWHLKKCVSYWHHTLWHLTLLISISLASTNHETLIMFLSGVQNNMLTDSFRDVNVIFRWQTHIHHHMKDRWVRWYFTFDMINGSSCSSPPLRVKPQGAPPCNWASTNTNFPFWITALLLPGKLLSIAGMLGKRMDEDVS